MTKYEYNILIKHFENLETKSSDTYEMSWLNTKSIYYVEGINKCKNDLINFFNQNNQSNKMNLKEYKILQTMFSNITNEKIRVAVNSCKSALHDNYKNDRW